MKVKLVVVVALCGVVIVAAMVAILVPTIQANIRRGQETARLENEASLGNAASQVQEMLVGLENSAKLFADLLEEGKGMDIPASFDTIVPVMWAMVRDNPMIEQATFGSEGDEGIAMDTPESLAEDGYPASMTKLKIKLANTSLACRSYFGWNSRDVHNITTAAQIASPKCDYSFPGRSWFRKIKAKTVNNTGYDNKTTIVATELEPNFGGSHVTAAAGRYVRSSLPTARPWSTSKGVAAIDFSTRRLVAVLNQTRLAPRQVIAFFVVSEKGFGDIAAMVPLSESLSLIDPTIEDEEDAVIGLKNVSHLNPNHRLRRISPTIQSILAVPGNHTAISTQTVLEHGARRIVSWRDVYMLGGTLHWRAVSVTPEEDFTEHITRERNLTIAVCIPVAVVLILLESALLLYLLSPVGVVGHRMALTARFADDGAEDESSGSFVAEVAALENAYLAMRKQLNRIRSFVPQSVLMEEDDEIAEELMDMTHLPPEAERESSPGSRGRSDRAARDSGKVSVRSMRSLTSDTRQGSVAPVAALGMNRTSLGLSGQQVSVLTLNLSRFHHSLSMLSLDAIVETYRHMSGTIVQQASEHRGVVDNFQGDHYYVSFNAASTCHMHATRAVAAATAILQHFDSRPAFSGVVTGGVATGKALVGNLGSDAMKRHCTIGEVYTQATVLERLAKHYDTGREGLVAASQRVMEETATSHATQVLDLVPLSGGQVQPVAALRGRLDALTKDAPSPAAPTDGEWLYNLTNNPYGPVNEAFLAIQRLVNGADTTAHTVASLVAAAEKAAADGSMPSGAARSMGALRKWAAHATGGGPSPAAEWGVYFDTCTKALP